MAQDLREPETREAWEFTVYTQATVYSPQPITRQGAMEQLWESLDVDDIQRDTGLEIVDGLWSPEES